MCSSPQHDIRHESRERVCGVCVWGKSPDLDPGPERQGESPDPGRESEIVGGVLTLYQVQRVGKRVLSQPRGRLWSQETNAIQIDWSVTHKHRELRQFRVVQSDWDASMAVTAEFRSTYRLNLVENKLASCEIIRN